MHLISESGSCLYSMWVDTFPEGSNARPLHLGKESLLVLVLFSIN